MSQNHNVFISWSGKRSLGVAQKLRDWLPTVVQAARPWMLDRDIEKGTRSLNEITTALNGIKVGIVCLTPENLNEPWLLFEAGALSKTITEDKNRLCTYLLAGLTSHEIKQPLGTFQHTPADKEETRKLVHAINKAVSETPVTPEHLDKTFNALWQDLEATIKAIPANTPDKVSPKRDLQDMIGEILDLVRADASARNNPQPYNFITAKSFPSVKLSDLAVNAWPSLPTTFTLQDLVNKEAAKVVKVLEETKKSAKEAGPKEQQKK